MNIPESSFVAEMKGNEITLVARSSRDTLRGEVIDKLVKAGFKPFGTVEQEIVKGASSSFIYPDDGKIVELPLGTGYYVTIVSEYWEVYYWRHFDSIENAKESAVELLSWSPIGAIVYVTQNLNCYARTFSVSPIAEIANSDQIKEIRGY